MPTSSPSNVTTKENPPNSSATPTSKSPPKSSSATAKEKEKEQKSAAAGKGSMGARLSTTPGSAGKAPSTVSASSTHTASTMPVDSAEAKAKSKSGGGVAGFLRRKPSSKEPAAGAGSGKKDAKKGVGSSLRTSLFKRSTKGKNGTDAPDAAASSAAGSSSSSTAPAATNSAGAASSSGSSTAAKPPSGASTSTEKGRASPEKGRTSPGKGRASPEKRRASSDNSPGARRGASPSKSQRPSSRTDTPPADRTKKSPSPGVASAARTNQALTPERKEALKKQWFTDGKDLPEPAGRGRATSRTGTGAVTGSRTEPRSRPGAGETVGPPATASRVSGSAFSAAAAKFGGVKTPAKPRPVSPKKADKSPTSPKKVTEASGSPKKTGTALSNPKKSDSPGSTKKSNVPAKPVAAEGLGDLMDAMIGFKAESVESKDTDVTENQRDKADVKPPAEDETVSSSVSKEVGAKADTKSSAPAGGLDDLMGAMEGFNPNGSQKDKDPNGSQHTDKSKTGKAGDITDMSESQSDKTKERKDRPESELVSRKDKAKTADKKGASKSDHYMKASDDKKDPKTVSKEGEKLKAGSGSSDSKTGETGSKSDSSASKDKDNSHDAKTIKSHDEAVEPKADKTSTWRHGDSDSGELGLGGISQKDREERSQRPSAPKDEMVDLDFLMGQIDTTPKPPAKEAARSAEDDSPKARKKRKSADADAGLDDLMDLAKGFDMSAMSKSEPVAAKAAAAPEMAPSDMDKFLDMMDTTPAKPNAPPAGPPVKEEKLVKKDTWRTGDGDEEAMVALMNKPRDKDAPSQPPDWNIDDLLVDKVTKKPEAKEDKLASDKDKKDDKAGERMSSDAGHLVPEPSGKSSAAAGDTKKADNKPSEKDGGNKKPTGSEFAAFDDFLSSSLSPGGDSDKTSEKTTKKPDDKKLSGSDFSAFDDFLSSSPSSKQSAEAPAEAAQEDIVADPKKVSAVDTAPPTHVEEEVVAATTASQTTAAPVKPKPTSDKHISKEGDTRGSVPDHGHGVRDVLYDDKDKTGRKPPAPREDPKSREPAVLDDLIRPAKASTTSSAPPSAGKEEVVVAQTASTTEAGKPSGKKVSDEHREKPGNTRGSVPDHGHGVRDLLYDDSDKTGRKKSDSKEDAKPREPAVLEDLIQPKKASGSHAAPGESHTPSSGEDDTEEGEEAISAETAHQSQAAGQTAGKKKRRSRKKKQAKEGDTRGSVPDQGHGVRDVLYDDSDKTGRKKTPSESKTDTKSRDPAVLDDLVQPKKAASSHAAPAARSPSPESKKTEEVVTTQTAHPAQAAAPVSGKKANKKKQSKEGDTRGSVPDHGHGARDVLYDDKDKTGRRKSDSKEDTKQREPAPLDDLVQPKKAAVSHSAAPAKKSSSRSPSPDEEEGEDEISAETAHQSQASGQAGGKKKRRSRKKKHAKEGDTRGSVPDHGHGVRDVLYDDSDKTGQKKTDTKQPTKGRDPEPLDDLIRPAQATHTSSAPPAPTATTSTGAEHPLVAEKVATVRSAPAASSQHQEPERKSLSLAGMTDPDQEDSDDGEELRRLIASTEALQAKLHGAGGGDSKQARTVQEQTSLELERLERSLEQRQERLESAGRSREVQAAREGLQKVKQQLEDSRAGGGKPGH